MKCKMTGQIQIDFLNLNIYPHTHIPLHPLLRYIHKEEQIKNDEDEAGR